MPELVEQMFCSQQIVVPPKFPYILKRYCKAAIKTQPYDLLRWSYEYFKALAKHRPPPVKLRLEYPVYSTEGGLTRGCLKVFVHQLSPMKDVPLPAVKAAWRGFCLDIMELRRILCLCEVYLRSDTVPFLHFLAVAGGLLTKSLTHTMILLCESLTAEPDGGSAAVPVEDFLVMYKFLAKVDASADVCYNDGYREGEAPEPEAVEEEDEMEPESLPPEEPSTDGFWAVPDEQGPLLLQKLDLIDDQISKNVEISKKLNAPISTKIERSPSIERAAKIERENFMRDRKARAPSRDLDIDLKLREMSTAKFLSSTEENKDPPKQEKKPAEKKKDECEIIVFNEDDEEIPYTLYGEPKFIEGDDDEDKDDATEVKGEDIREEDVVETEADKLAIAIADLFNARELRREDLENTFEEIVALVNRFKSANYDLGMVAGRQMSTTSGEFIVHHIEKEILEYIDEQIAILPDPDLKKKKAKPEEVEMIRELLENFIEDNIEVICPEVEEVEEEETPIPEIVKVFAVPGIGPPVDPDIVSDFEEYVLEAVKVQADLFMPRNIRHFLCPPLEKFEEIHYDHGGHHGKKRLEEAVPTEGAITD